ncbi:MAG TPA: DUF4234 domain-containing protein [Clostridiales bacterium]|nr:DUF4234 domain-containing protein [Clostridiales bacterium]
MIQKRNIGLAILYSILTCGIYSMYWFVKITDEANALSGKVETTGGMALLLSIVTCGIYRYFWSYKMGKTIYTAQERLGVNPMDNSILYLILSIFGLDIVSYAIIQSDINVLV